MVVVSVPVSLALLLFEREDVVFVQEKIWNLDVKTVSERDFILDERRRIDVMCNVGSFEDRGREH